MEFLQIGLLRALTRRRLLCHALLLLLRPPSTSSLSGSTPSMALLSTHRLLPLSTFSEDFELFVMTYIHTGTAGPCYRADWDRSRERSGGWSDPSALLELSGWISLAQLKLKLEHSGFHSHQLFSKFLMCCAKRNQCNILSFYSCLYFLPVN